MSSVDENERRSPIDDDDAPPTPKGAPPPPEEFARGKVRTSVQGDVAELCLSLFPLSSIPLSPISPIRRVLDQVLWSDSDGVCERMLLQLILCGCRKIACHVPIQHKRPWLNIASSHVGMDWVNLPTLWLVWQANFC